MSLLTKRASRILYNRKIKESQYIFHKETLVHTQMVWRWVRCYYSKADLTSMIFRVSVSQQSQDSALNCYFLRLCVFNLFCPIWSIFLALLWCNLYWCYNASKPVIIYNPGYFNLRRRIIFIKLSLFNISIVFFVLSCWITGCLVLV